jgi:hypothetical protein
MTKGAGRIGYSIRGVPTFVTGDDSDFAAVWQHLESLQPEQPRKQQARAIETLAEYSEPADDKENALHPKISENKMDSRPFIVFRICSDHTGMAGTLQAS